MIVRAFPRTARMRPEPTPEDWTSVLREGRSLVLVSPSPSEPASFHRIVRGTVDRRATICVGGAQYDVVVFTSAQSGATIVPFILEDRKAVLLGLATAFEFLHSMDGGAPAVHGNLNIDVVSVVDGTVIISGFEHCGVPPVLPGPAESHEPPSDGTLGSWSPPPGHISSMAPELIQTGIRTTQTDVYAFGVLMFRMYAGAYPFAGLVSNSHFRAFIDPAILRMAAGNRPAREDIQHPDFTDELWDLMNECWARAPSDRPTMASVRARLAQMA